MGCLPVTEPLVPWEYLLRRGVERKHPFSPLPVFLACSWSGVHLPQGTSPQLLLECGSRELGHQESGEGALEPRCSWGIELMFGSRTCSQPGKRIRTSHVYRAACNCVRINVVTPFYPQPFSLAFICSHRIHSKLALGGEPLPPGAITAVTVLLSPSLNFMRTMSMVIFISVSLF